MSAFFAIAAIVVYAACSKSFGYWMANNSILSKDKFAMEFFNKPDPELNDGFDDDFDKTKVKEKAEYFDL